VPGGLIRTVAGVTKSAGNSAGTALLFTQLVFRLPSGDSSSLHSKGDVLSYVGNVGVDRAAPAFFSYSYGKEFHCQSGSLVPNDPAANKAANFRFAFRNPSGLESIVDLTGDQPAYSGALSVDPSAKAFFDRLWRLCHCQVP
jgi:hypothetical protein